jgi:hypothetical protein
VRALLIPLLLAASSAAGAEALRCDLPAALEPERAVYESDIEAGLAQVMAFFRDAGHDLSGETLVTSATVFADVATARAHLAETFETPLENIPETFAGTVVGQVLFVVSREAYCKIWCDLYPDWPWTDETYRQLIVHELAHRAHEAIAIAHFGSAEAMGPAWFFEGLAVVCAGQFPGPEPLLSAEEIAKLAGPGITPPESYPLYGRLVRSLAASQTWAQLLAAAAER